MAKQIRVHNRGKREFTIPPEQKENAKKGDKKGKDRILLPGRAIELEEKTALKYIGLYPNDLIKYDSLVSGKTKDLGKENDRLKAHNTTLTEESNQIKQDSQDLKDKIKDLEESSKGKDKRSLALEVALKKLDPENELLKIQEVPETDQNKKD